MVVDEDRVSVIHSLASKASSSRSFRGLVLDDDKKPPPMITPMASVRWNVPKDAHEENSPLEGQQDILSGRRGGSIGGMRRLVVLVTTRVDKFSVDLWHDFLVISESARTYRLLFPNVKQV